MWPPSRRLPRETASGPSGARTRRPFAGKASSSVAADGGPSRRAGAAGRRPLVAASRRVVAGGLARGGGPRLDGGLVDRRRGSGGRDGPAAVRGAAGAWRGDAGGGG